MNLILLVNVGDTPRTSRCNAVYVILGITSLVTDTYIYIYIIV